MITKQSFIEWNPMLYLGVPLIDKQHEKMIQLVNNLYSACLQKNESAGHNIAETINEAVNFLKYHLVTEEKMMLLLEYPEYMSQKKEHEGFIMEILNQINSLTDKNQRFPNRFFHLLKEWLMLHIIVCDKKFTEYLLNLKNNEKLQSLFPKPV